MLQEQRERLHGWLCVLQDHRWSLQESLDALQEFREVRSEFVKQSAAAPSGR